MVLELDSGPQAGERAAVSAGSVNGPSNLAPPPAAAASARCLQVIFTSN